MRGRVIEFLKLLSCACFSSFLVLSPGQTTRFFIRFCPQHFISKLCVVEHVWPKDSICARLFFQLFNYSYFSIIYQPKIFTITNICPLNETLLHMLSLDFLDKLAKRVDFHSTTIILLDLFGKDQTPLNITRLHSTRLAHSLRWP